MLNDRFGRHINYLRISLTDKCNLRCVYCMPEEMTFKPRQELLQDDELLRLARIFERDESGLRPVFGGTKKFQEDPSWQDHLLFYEYFHGDNGAGLGASHQTGWTGLVAVAYKLFAGHSPERFLRPGPLMRLLDD